MNKEEEKVRIKLERHLWPDEMAEKEKKQSDRLITLFVIISMVLVFIGGWVLGSVKPLIKANIDPQQMSETKLDKILDIMSNSWHFAKEDPNIQQTLMDQALYGMVNNEKDPHSAYLSSEDLLNFTQSINMNFVGIGVQYIATDGINMIDKVFKNSPAEEAGVLAGDIINKIDGVSVEGLTSDDIKNMVRGESNSKVIIEFLRQGTPIELEITRREVTGTVSGKMLEEGMGYLEIYQFGDSTADEVGLYLQDLTDQGMNQLIIDLRNNGGGYLDALVGVASYFIPKDTLVMKQEHADGSINESYSLGKEFTNIDEIIILINENTASASEVLTLTLQEQRDDVTVIGTTSYGKGTVQVTQPFSDGSALKYTTTKWLSPSGKSIDGKGIVPDIEVELDNILNEKYITMNEDEVYELDTVSMSVKIMQESLQFLGYDIDRIDGYFDSSSDKALKQFEKDKKITVDGILDVDTLEALLSSVTKEWALNPEKDIQLNKAIEVFSMNE